MQIKQWKRSSSLIPKRRGKLIAGLLLHKDNAPVHTAQAKEAEATHCGFELLPYPLYSSVLVLSDYFLLHKLKSCMHRRHFGNNNEVICAVEEFLKD